MHLFSTPYLHSVEEISDGKTDEFRNAIRVECTNQIKLSEKKTLDNGALSFLESRHD